ncbi:MAG: nitronate monooxygenase, partial [Sphingomonadales bacterium]
MATEKSTRHALFSNLTLPVVAAPMFLISGPDLVVAACRSGVIGGFPTLNARTLEQLDDWLKEIEDRLDAHNQENPTKPAAPHAANLIVHRSNSRASDDLALLSEHKVPIVITSVGHPGDTAHKVHDYGGVVFHDVINLHHARKAAEAGVDGLILVCGGAGGHAGLMNPFAFVPQVRAFFDGIILLAGGISNGRAVRAAEVLGADLAYMGTRFINTGESLADDAYKAMIIEAEAKDIVYTDKVSGINANFLLASLQQAGLAPGGDGPKPDIEMGKDEAKAWKNVWSAGQGVGEI